MAVTLNPAGDRRPLLIFVVGRQRVGKTTLLNTVVQFVRAHGGEITVQSEPGGGATFVVRLPLVRRGAMA